MKVSFPASPRIIRGIFILGCLLSYLTGLRSQDNSIVVVHADKSSGYGVAWGGPQNSQDYIVTALHIVAGKKKIIVAWQGKTTTATVEKIYTPSDLALLKLDTPLGIRPLTLYPGDAPWDTNINFWEVTTAATMPTKKTTTLEGKTSLAKISPLIENQTDGLSKALCQNAGQYYPGMNTNVINFKEPNIRKAHSGSPLTYGDKILGMVDGGARLVGGKPCVWAIPASDFNKLFSQGEPPSSTMASCDSPGGENKYMYSGIRSDNPMLTMEETTEALVVEYPMEFCTNTGEKLELYHNYTMRFSEVYETLFDSEKEYLNGLFINEDSISMEDLLNMDVSFYVEAKTGVSVMIPARCTLASKQDNLGTLNTTTSPGGLTTLSFYISTNDAMDDGMVAMNAYKDALKSKGQPIQPVTDEEQLKEHNKYYSEYFENKTVAKKGGNVKTIFFTDMIVNDGDFLAVTLNVPDWHSVAINPQEKLFFYLMETCTVISDFSIY